MDKKYGQKNGKRLLYSVCKKFKKQDKMFSYKTIINKLNQFAVTQMNKVRDIWFDTCAHRLLSLTKTKTIKIMPIK